MQKGNRVRPMIGGGIGPLGEITQRMGQLDQALSSLRHDLFPTQAVPNRTDGIAQSSRQRAFRSAHPRQPIPLRRGRSHHTSRSPTDALEGS